MQRRTAPPLFLDCALFGAMALVAAFPNVVVQALILGAPKVCPEVEAHLTEQLGEAAVAVLYVVVGGKVHVEGRLDLLHAFLAQRLQRLLELGQSVDAGNGKYRCPGEGVDHVGLHGPFCENDSCRRPACEMDPAFGAAAVGLLRAGGTAADTGGYGYDSEHTGRKNNAAGVFIYDESDMR